jgi:hypothetical protein
MKFSELENAVMNKDDEFRKCENKSCKRELKAWKVNKDKVYKETLGKINIEKASTDAFNKAVTKFNEGVKISNANIEWVKCTITKCEANMWTLLDAYIKLFKTKCHDNNKMCMLVSEAMDIRKSKNISECQIFLNKSHR